MTHKIVYLLMSVITVLCFACTSEDTRPSGSDGDADTDSDVDTECDTDDAGTDTDSETEPIDPLTAVWVEIPGGTFEMGDEGGAWTTPIHTVTVPTFEIAKFETTVGQYQQCLNEGVCGPFPDVSGIFPPEMEMIDSLPALVNVSEASVLCDWMGARLPTEAEWEFAARGGGQDINFPWGNEEPNCDFVVFDSSEIVGMGCGADWAWPVCSKPAGNTLQGLCDMAGNFYEVVADSWHNNYEGAPTDGSAWMDGGEIDFAMRGGSAEESSAFYLQVWYRENTGQRSGFRCARDVE